MRILRVLAPLVIGVAALSACTTPPQTPQTSPSPSDAGLSPAPTPEAVGPVAAFDGDCANVLTQQQVESILGVGATDQASWSEANAGASARRGIDLNAESTAGGLECTWMGGEGAGLPEGMDGISVYALPEAAVTGVDFSDPRCEPSYDSTLCRMSRVANGVWLMARAGWQLSAPPVEQLDAALTAAAANLASFPAPVSATRGSTWWELPSCDDIASHIGLSDLAGANLYGGFEGGPSPQPEDELLDDAGVARRCAWFTDSGSADPAGRSASFALEIMPGGAGWWDDVAAHPDATAVTIPGAEGAIVTGEEGTHIAVATDGVNVLRAVHGHPPDNDFALVVELGERALAALATAP
ncbi:hypothetical protein NQ156_12580 [Microbacterium sp. zg.Y625]|uniref:hypothetical protein n=1 Tax=Microbacterium jiangjiandongii TaxID=3049071 RepID=UPI00214CD8C7|nr:MULTISPECIES: hypothetical protein [unclassified Microbacterium]MCR2793902.1 hypothetical protein [Microbacterium sp. zg.Y625]WIM26236.1 hypothetical protein QNO14_04060 [Microbacterium sp. zg-Y625]